MIVFRHMQGRDRPSNMAKRGGEGGGAGKFQKNCKRRAGTFFLIGICEGNLQLQLGRGRG